MELLLVTAYLLTIIGGLEVMSRCCPRSALLRLTMQETVDCDTLHHGSRHRSLAQISPASHTLANVDRKRKLVMFYCSPGSFPTLTFLSWCWCWWTLGLPGHDSHTASCLLQLYNSSESEAAAEYAGLQGRAGHTLTLRHVIFLQTFYLYLFISL